ncbi:MAG: esterase [Asticcacaulis sp.]|uniref:esterase n=1 Tax=Asticcacaulis sp. TaxID=1872648 RepID=UPI0039E274AC
MTSIIIQRPGAPDRLVLLFHGVGALPQNMVTLGKVIADAHPNTAVVSVASPYPSDTGGGYQWFSVRGVTEETRPARVTEAMPAFIACVKQWQAEMQVPTDETLLIGFSQGAIMALESTQQADRIAATVIGLSGRFAAPPETKPAMPVHLIHGDADPIMAAAHAIAAHDQLVALGADVTLDIVPGLPHTINAEVTRRLLTYVN